eukprot:EG_transcript_27820
MASHRHCFPHPIQRYTELLPLCNGATLIVWDVDDTLLCTTAAAGPRSGLVDEQGLADLLAACRDLPDPTHHLLLTAGSVTDLFIRQSDRHVPRLRPFRRHFGVPTLGSHIFQLPDSRHFTLDGAVGISTKRDALPPSSLCIHLEDASKLDVLRALAGSGAVGRVLLVDNSLQELGVVCPAFPAATYADPGWRGCIAAEGVHAAHPLLGHRASDVFSGDLVAFWQ